MLENWALHIGATVLHVLQSVLHLSDPYSHCVVYHGL